MNNKTIRKFKRRWACGLCGESVIFDLYLQTVKCGCGTTKTLMAKTDLKTLKEFFINWDVSI